LSRDEAHLLDILKAARLAIEFKGSADRSEFLRDAKTQAAVLHQLLLKLADYSDKSRGLKPTAAP